MTHETTATPTRDRSEPVEERMRWTSADIDRLPDNGTRYEVIDGELYMTHAPHWRHQEAFGNIYHQLQDWSRTTGLGRASPTPGVIFSEYDDVIPDVVWASAERLKILMDDAGHFRGAPELVVEILSPGAQNEERDRETKLKLYALKGVQEYWIADWRLRQVEVYRRERGRLKQVSTLLAADEITSPLLPGFACVVAKFFD